METLQTGAVSLWSMVESGVVFWFVTLGIGLFVTLHLRGTLKKVARPTRKPTLFLVLGLCVALPIGGGFAGCMYAGQRGGAELLEKADPGRLIVVAIEAGAKQLRTEVALTTDDTLVDPARTVALAKAKQASSGLVDRLWWQLVEVVVTQAGPKPITIATLIDEGERQLKAKVREKFHDHAADLRKTARRTLLLFIGVAALAFGLAFWLVRRRAA